VQKNHPTVAQIVNGATVVKEIPTTIVRDHSLELLLREPGFHLGLLDFDGHQRKIPGQFAASG
jgi:hypothetical protein